MSNLQAPSGPAPTFDDVWRMFQETNTRFQETDRQFKATERVMKDRAAETDRIVKDLSRSVGALGNWLGDFVEALPQSPPPSTSSNESTKAARSEKNFGAIFFMTSTFSKTSACRNSLA